MGVKCSFSLREENSVVLEEREWGEGWGLQKMWVLRGVIAPKKEKVAGRQKTTHDEEIHNLYSSPSATRKNKSRRMRWASSVVHIVEVTSE